MSRNGYLGYGACLAGITLLTAEATINSVLFLYDYAVHFTVPAVAGWFIATFCPIFLSLMVWKMSGRITVRWLPHIAFIPVAIVIFRLGSSLFYGTLGVSGDSLADGLALLTGSCYLMFALLIHLAAVIFFGVTGSRRQTNDG